MDKKGEEITGGLRIKYPLGEKPVPKLYTDLIENDFRTNGAGFDYESSQKARDLMTKLRTKPTNIVEYVDQQETYTQFSWAYEKSEYRKKNCEGCTITPGTENGLYRIQAPALMDYALELDLKEKTALGIEPEFAIGTVVHHGTIKQIDALNNCIWFTSRGKFHDKETYSIYETPSTLNYRSRMRTLQWILERTKRSEEGDMLVKNYFFPKREEQPREFSREKVQKYLQKESRRLNFAEHKTFNPIQRMSITGIVGGWHDDIPYINFGPPGTGKTHCLVEAVRQLCQRNDRDRVLVCAPSNTAADLFTLGLLETGSLPAESIFRCFSLSKPVSQQNPLLQDVIYVVPKANGERSFGIYPKEDLEKFRVIVCTLAASTYLVSGGLQCKFSHIFVDEAGQADDVETLIPIIGLAGKNTKVILAGDPRQLGPVEMCDKLKNLCDKKSLIERLVCFRHDNQMHMDETYICMLEENYRSHEALIEVPSRLYYSGLLKASAPIDEKNSLVDWKPLPRKGFPILFHTLAGFEEKEVNGFSYGNREEARIVVNYIQDLLTNTNVAYEEIGVITPYRYQIKIISDMLQDNRITSITVDSVERFQGQERRVIIVSTVRSAGIGFLDSDKRFNTTVTRPQELLVIVGNHYNLQQVPCWREYIDFCRENGAIYEPKQEIVQKQAPIGRLRIPDSERAFMVDEDPNIIVDEDDDDGGDVWGGTPSSGSTNSFTDHQYYFEEDRTPAGNRVLSGGRGGGIDLEYGQGRGGSNSIQQFTYNFDTALQLDSRKVCNTQFDTNPQRQKPTTNNFVVNNPHVPQQQSSSKASYSNRTQVNNYSRTNESSSSFNNVVQKQPKINPQNLQKFVPQKHQKRAMIVPDPVPDFGGWLDEEDADRFRAMDISSTTSSTRRNAGRDLRLDSAFGNMHLNDNFC